MANKKETTIEIQLDKGTLKKMQVVAGSRAKHMTPKGLVIDAIACYINQVFQLNYIE